MTDPLVILGAALVSSPGLVKLLEIIQAQLRPPLIRKEGEATAEATKTQANAEAYAILTKGEADAQAERLAALKQAETEIEVADMWARVRNREAAQAIRRQYNIEAIGARAIKYLPGSVSSEPVDPDWVNRFFSDVEDISNEELQEIWARLLAGEVAQPGTFSRRLLGILRDLSPEEAQKWTVLSSLVWRSGSDAFVAFPYSLESLLQSIGLSYEDLLEFEAVGLVLLETKAVVLNNGKIEYQGTEYPLVRTARFQAYPLSRVGKELARLVVGEPNEPYRDHVLKLLKAHEFMT